MPKRKTKVEYDITKDYLNEKFEVLDEADPVLINNFLNKKELLDGDEFSKIDKFSYLYPSLDDPDFNIKITERKEFYDTKMEVPDIVNIEQQANEICNAEFELSPHQMFVRNFLSFETPYNSLLLYHGLGTGKTCSAISIAEEMRDYMKQMGINNRIIVVASPNVQKEFRSQLFDERKLKQIDGLWNLHACTGNKYLKEINPMNMKGMSKNKVVRQVSRIINTSYMFTGYLEFANMIQRKSTMEDETPSKIRRALKKFFQNRLIIIDEVQNIRSTDENTTNKRVASELMKLIENVDNIRLLLLSATPMYNSYKEIIWLINLMNKNDRRGTIGISEVFDKQGNFLIDNDGYESGIELLRRKITGYISFVKGENPLSFPFRIFPSNFSVENTFQQFKVPDIQLNGKKVIQPIEHVDVFLTNIGSYQGIIYKRIISDIRDKGEDMPNFENMDSFGYIMLQQPLMALNMCYPSNNPETVDTSSIVGKEGLNKFMSFTDTTVPLVKSNFEYKTLEYGRFFSPSNIGKYSAKIKNICDSILNSEGIILIYTNYIDGGAIPIALALEEMGMTRYGTKAHSLFKTAPTPAIDSKTFTSKNNMAAGVTFNAAKYVIISGDKSISPDNDEDRIALTNEENYRGEKVKVVIITRAGSEGLDFKNVRQVHIMEPWYNMNLIEQIIGRAVRTCSHKLLPFKERNVQIFLYGTILDNDEEAADIYVYRLAEMKAVQIGRVSRILKESSIDCMLNIKQNKYNADALNTNVPQLLSDGSMIDFPIGDKPYSASCDYLKTCTHICRPFKKITDEDIVMDTYSEKFIIMNSDKIVQKIRNAFKDRHFYKKTELINFINLYKKYPEVQINSALDQLIDDKNEYIFDEYKRAGHLINIDKYYMFQPIELEDNNISLSDRMVPIPFTRDKFEVNIHREITNNNNNNNIDNLETDLVVNKSNNKSEHAGKLILDSLFEKYNKAIEYIDKDYKLEATRGETDYYVYCSRMFVTLKSAGLTDDMISTFLISHLAESLIYTHIIHVLNFLYYTTDLSSFEKNIKNYFDNYILKAKNISGMLLAKDNKSHLIILNEHEWTNGESEDYHDLTAKIEGLIIPKEELSRYVGFLSEFKKEFMIFKVIDLADSKSKGARCDQSGKSIAINLLNSITSREQYTKENTRGRNKMELCILQEFILRYYNSIVKDGKKWFVTPIEAINSF